MGAKITAHSCDLSAMAQDRLLLQSTATQIDINLFVALIRAVLSLSKSSRTKVLAKAVPYVFASHR
jgi:hypothetical protein